VNTNDLKQFGRSILASVTVAVTRAFPGFPWRCLSCWSSRVHTNFKIRTTHLMHAAPFSMWGRKI